LPDTGEELARLLPGAHVFKAFNTIGVEHMVHPDGSLISGQRLTMMFAGMLNLRRRRERGLAPRAMSYY
jgi:hypothetical protein